MPIMLIYHGDEEMLDDITHERVTVRTKGGSTVDTIRELRPSANVVPTDDKPASKLAADEFKDALIAAQDDITRGKALTRVLLVPENLTVVNS